LIINCIVKWGKKYMYKPRLIMAHVHYSKLVLDWYKKKEKTVIFFGQNSALPTIVNQAADATKILGKYMLFCFEKISDLL
jgi:hypothetical protein